MSKKMLKRSLALGALMAFVITGSAMAAELGAVNVDTANDFKTATGLDALSGDGYCNFYIPYESESANELVTTGNIIYKSTEYGGNFGLFAGLSSNKADGQHLANPNGNTLNIKNDLKVDTKGLVYLFGGCIDTGADAKYESTAKGNSVYIGDGKTEITITAGNHIFIGGALGNDSNVNYNVIGNHAKVDNVKFVLPEESYVCIYGAEARSGSAKENKVEIVNTTIENANIFGGFVWSKGGNADSNIVTFNNVTLGDGAECAGGYVHDVEGNADGNTVNVEGNSKVAGIVYGGYSAKGTASNNTINIKDTADVSNANLYGDNGGAGTGNTLNIESGWAGAIGSVQNFDVINMNKGTDVTFGNALNVATVNINGATWNVEKEGNKVGALNCNDGKIVFGQNGHLDINGAGSGEIILTEVGKNADDLNTAEDLTTVAKRLGVDKNIRKDVTAKVVMAAGALKGETTGDVEFKNDDTNDDSYWHGVVKKATEKVNPTNASISEIHAVGLMAWRAENNDMNKRLGELRDANGEHGAWVRMTRGESEYKSVKNQYNAYQMGYDQKAGDWTVGAAVTYTEAETGFANGCGENDHTGFAVYGSKLNNDGSYIDLIAKYAKLDHEYNVSAGIGSGDYDTDGYAFSAEYGKRFEQGKGLWIEPQVELTYGKVDSVDFVADNGNVSLDDMDSLVGRIGFRAGKDIKDGNVYVRASYLYDFDGKTDVAFSDGKDTRSFEHDLGGGWWEVGVGANINLSKATYIYADIEKTFGGEVDTNWQWNLGVRYSF